MPENIQALYRYIMTGEAVDELTEKLQEAVEAGRRNEKWRAEYMKELLHEDDIREEGRAEERANTEREKARADALEVKAEREKAKAEKEKVRADSLEEKVRELEEMLKKSQ